MTLLAPLGLLAGLLAVPVLALHILMPHRDPLHVSSTYLWRPLSDPVAPNRPWQRLRWSIPLILQLLLVALLALALAQPARVQASPLASHSVFIIDTSGSMLATDGSPDRVELAKDRIRELRDAVPDGGSVSLVVAGIEPEVLVANSTDDVQFERELDRIRPTSGVVDFVEAFVLAEALTSPERATGWVLVSDGGLTIEEQRLAPAGLRYESVGEDDVNRAITALTITVDNGDLTAIVTIDNTGGPESHQQLRVDVDRVTVARREVTLPAGSTTEVAVAIPPGSRIEAFLDGDDLLLLDNARAALAPTTLDIRVRIERSSPEASFFVEEVLVALGATVVNDNDEDVDIVIYDGVNVPPEPTKPFISIASPVPPPGLVVVGSVETPVPTFLANDPLLDGVDISSVAVAAAQALAVDSGTVLIGSAEGQPLVIRGRVGDIGWFHFGFDLEESNLPVSVAYPILFARMVAALSFSDDLPASVTIGTRLPSLPIATTITGPRGGAQAVEAGGRMPVLASPGFWTVTEPDNSVRPIAVVFPAGESSLAVAKDLPNLTPAPESEDGPAAGITTRSLVPWVVGVALSVLALELLFSLGRLGVSLGQRIVADVVRLVIVVCLVGALIGVTIDRTNDNVRTVLVIDRSDSMGADGRATVDSFVAEVRSLYAPDQIAIVEVGSTARVAAAFGAIETVGIEPPADGTDLVRGVRLASSLLDGSYRERVIVISDGRSTAGDLVLEGGRLAELGISLDVHAVVPSVGADIGVQSVSAPSSVGEGEAYDIDAVITADRAAEVIIDLFNKDALLASQEVALIAGENEVVFRVEADEPGIDRYEVRVRDSGDAVPQNDFAFVAVNTDGPPTALVLEGDDDNGQLIADALTDRAVITDRRPVSEFPTLEELAGYRAVVLVDVAAADLADSQVDSLHIFVREQGNGLVVVGGSNSFAVGGYAETRFEDLLPIESRTDDPTRKATIAEVLLIDTSESMGACHCVPVEGGEGGAFGGEAVEGGVNKTDISRAAAERAIAALSASDEVGVLAFNAHQDWILPLQIVPDSSVVAETLSQLNPAGETRIAPALAAAAEGLRETSKELKHIILFTDGFTPELFFEEGMGNEVGPGITSLAELEAQARDLADEGITVSVVATGEGAAPFLESIAIAGGGRFYPGRDLDEIPEIFVEEARIASRSFINEGVFLPIVTSTAVPVRGLDAAPSLSGFLAAAPKDTADVMLQIGEFGDPLLSSWRIGLGRVTAWTSDGGNRWATEWAAWDGWADFWSTLVRDTFPLEGASGQQLRAEIRGESLFIELVSEDAWPAGTAPVAEVAGPDGSTTSIEMSRSSDSIFTAALPAFEVGSYAIGVVTESEIAGVGRNRVASAIASRSYSIEYRPTPPAPEVLIELSAMTGGRGEITAAQALDTEGLTAGSTSRELRWILLIAAVLLWPFYVALHRVRIVQLRDDLRAARAARRAA